MSERLAALLFGARVEDLFRTFRLKTAKARFRVLKHFSYRPLIDSGLFDTDYYLQKYPDIAAAKIDPFEHFMIAGASEGRNPNRWFHTRCYNLFYPDVARKRRNALLHYLQHGAEDGRDPSPWFDTVEYLVDHPGLVEAGINPLVHYMASGKTKLPDQLQERLVLQQNAERPVKHVELTDLIDFPPRKLEDVERAFDPASLRIHWIVPDFAPGGGGMMTILRVVRLLEQFGHRCTIWIARPIANRTERRAKDIATRHYQTFKADIKFLSSEFFAQEGDALICTSWETVVFGMHATRFKERFYFVQDYEPAFFATGSQSLAAEWTYKSDIACICASPWLAEKLHDMYGRWTRAGWLAVDFDVYRPPDRPCVDDSVPKIAFYARRYTERRAVELGLLALEQLAKKGVQFHVEFFGMKLNMGHLPYSYTSHGILSETELARLYRRSDIGIVFSSTNYSLVPQEMMASGLPVLELDAESTRRIYPKDVVTLAGPHPLDIAEKLAALLEKPERRASQAKAALTWVNQFTWEKFARVAEGAILERLTAKGFSASPKPSAPPVVKGRPKVSVVIPTYNGGALFRKVLAAVQAQRTPWPFDTIILDSESSDGTAQFAADTKGVIFRSIPKKQFQHGRTRNLGAEMASGEYVALLTQDAMPVNQHWLDDMIAVLEKYPRAAGAFGRHVAYPEASPFLTRDMIAHFASFDPHPVAVSKYTSYRRWRRGEIGWRQQLHYFSDNNACLRKSAWNKIPYPDIDYGEDQVWAARIIEAGYEKVYAKAAAVFHSHDYTPAEMSERSEIEGRFFKTYFGYDLAPADTLMERHIANLNAHDAQWAAANSVDEKWLALQKQLNAAKVNGWRAGMLSARYVGYNKKPAAGIAS